jgi:hypothetical protein
MKLQTATTTIEQIGNISQEAQFTMKTSRKAFQILSDLYSDKPLAIVRELGANAKDAMVAAGKGDQPFHVKLPNALEPWIVIEDKGTGISHEDIYNVYTKYFESTKSESNDFVGCLGLGSKSPFCYSDNFLITSTHQGVKRIYNAFFSQTGTPAISLMSTENTDQGNGLAIQIPVKLADVNTFCNAVAKAFRFFKIKPSITGGTIDWKINKVMFEGEGWEAHEGFTYGECYAIMGGVTYPVDRYKLSHEAQNFCAKGGVVMYFEIGELDVTPSRESLSYDDATIKSLESKFVFIKKDFEEKLTKNIEDKSNLLDALRSHWNLSRTFAHLTTNFDNVKWRGIELSNPAQLISKISKGDVMTHSFTKYSRSKYRESVFVSIDTKAKWYVDDLAKGTTARVKQHLRINNDDLLCVFSKETFDTLVNHKDANYRFDASMFIPTSTLPKVVNTPKWGIRIPKVGFNVYTFGTSWHSRWDSETFDSANPPKYYIVKQGSTWDISMQTAFGGISGKSGLRSLLRFLKLGESDVVMVSPQNEKHISAFSKNFKDVANDIKIDLDEDTIATAQHYTADSYQDVKKHSKFNKLKQDSDFVVFVNKVCKAHQAVKKYEQILGMFSMSKGKPAVLDSQCPITNLMVKRMGRYGWEVEDILTILENFQK